MSKEVKKKKPVELTPEEIRAQQKERVELAGIQFDDKQLQEYFKNPDDLGVNATVENRIDAATKSQTAAIQKAMDDGLIPKGYKRCGRCCHILKLYLFNKNSGSKLNATGNCKACQKATARQSYGRIKKKRNYKKYYAEHKEEKQEQARRYYAENKEKLDARHAEYVRSKKGKAVMHKAHAKRRNSIKENQGIPYNRKLLIERDGKFINLEHPVCLLCGKPILDTTGTHCHIDHIIGVVNGGPDCMSNVHLVHKDCNLRRTKDQRDLDDKLVKTIKERTAKFIDWLVEEGRGEEIEQR